MDPLSQAVVGATLAGVCCRRKAWMRPAIVAGMVGGLSPDLDIFIRSSHDPLLFLEYHRHFTHAFFFSPIGGLFAAMLCWPVLKRWMPFAWIYVFATLGWATHGVLDAMTNYGTHLWWPFTNRRESWSIISIIDPIFTLTLLALVIASFKARARRYMAFAAVFAVMYWSLGIYQREAATRAMHALASERGHAVERSEVKPSFANLVVWRAQYEYRGRYYVDAVRVTPWDVRWYEGTSAAAFKADDVKLDKDSQSYRDLQRFAFFSDGWLAAQADDPLVIGDVRFAALPNETQPLWGIRLKPDDAQAHVDFVNFRSARMERLPLLWGMITGAVMPAQAGIQ